MTKILEATYSNGTLILSEALDPALEGKKLKVMILETNELNGEELSPQARRQRFLDAAAKHSFDLPPGYKFDRIT
jgi:predicted DNA-binding antitoxin AbrB/MazE fold protein